jgi:hypothetical protein
MFLFSNRQEYLTERFHLYISYIKPLLLKTVLGLNSLIKQTNYKIYANGNV